MRFKPHSFPSAYLSLLLYPTKYSSYSYSIHKEMSSKLFYRNCIKSKRTSTKKQGSRKQVFFRGIKYVDIAKPHNKSNSHEWKWQKWGQKQPLSHFLLNSSFNHDFLFPSNLFHNFILNKWIVYLNSSCIASIYSLMWLIHASINIILFYYFAICIVIEGIHNFFFFDLTSFFISIFPLFMNNVLRNFGWNFPEESIWLILIQNNSSNGNGDANINWELFYARVVSLCGFGSWT